jgi:hypothetical protein
MKTVFDGNVWSFESDSFSTQLFYEYWYSCQYHETYVGKKAPYLNQDEQKNAA